MTEKLYDLNGRARAFSARVLSCAEKDGKWAVELDRTAFFPMGGGQEGDQGILHGVRVTDTVEEDGRIYHLCVSPLPVGAQVQGTLDWELRFARMQVHSGEHIVSGIAHDKWGCENVGFHMTAEGAVLDFDRELDARQLRELEEEANRAVWANLPFRVWYPSPEELAALSFRQKKELRGPVRLVEIQGIDRCACCAPHVERSGEIGLIRLSDPMRHRGGVRLTLRAGLSAWQEDFRLGRDADSLCRLLSAPRTGLPEAVQALQKRMEEQKAALAAAERRYTALLLDTAGETEGDLCFFLPAETSAAAARELCEQGGNRCGGICAVFTENPAGGWRYVMASGIRDLRAESRALNAALRGRGGGSPGMIQGSAEASREEITALFHDKIIG
ncbi:MAG: hypothetical protein IKO22_06155 [Oscillospiraceae bacterium]|nr:hypothetical protein [Oscillospiraceae bacterium]